MTVRTAACLAIATLALAGCTSAAQLESRAEQTPSRTPPASAKPSATPAKPEPTTPLPESALRKYYTQKLEWRGCGSKYELQCADLTVPYSYYEADKGYNVLPVVRRPADKQPSKLGTVVFHRDGMADEIYWAEDYFRKQVLASFDLVGFDRRGFGSDDELTCLSPDVQDEQLALDESPDTEAEWKALLAGTKEFAEGCRRVASMERLPTFSNEVAARDLDVLRSALGLKKVRLWATSSTTMGVNYAKLFPARVERMILEAPDAPGGTALEHGVMRARRFEAAFDDFLDGCVSDKCGLGSSVEQARENVTAMLDGLEDEPIAVGERRLTRELAVAGIRFELANIWERRLGSELVAARDGNGTDLLQRADWQNGRNESGIYDQTLGANVAVRCLERTGLGDTDPRRFVRSLTNMSPVAGAAIAREYLPCFHWGVPPAKPVRAVAPLKAPVLVVALPLDPEHPYAMAKQLLREVPSGKLFASPGRGHVAYNAGITCVDAAMEAYLVQGTVPETEQCYDDEEAEDAEEGVPA